MSDTWLAAERSRRLCGPLIFEQEGLGNDCCVAEGSQLVEQPQVSPPPLSSAQPSRLHLPQESPVPGWQEVAASAKGVSGWQLQGLFEIVIMASQCTAAATAAVSSLRRWSCAIWVQWALWEGAVVGLAQTETLIRVLEVFFFPSSSSS